MPPRRRRRIEQQRCIECGVFSNSLSCSRCTARATSNMLGAEEEEVEVLPQIEERAEARVGEEEDAVTTAEQCDNCKRWSVGDGLGVGEAITEGMKSRKYGAVSRNDLRTRESVNVCKECVKYLRDGGGWRYAWPSVIYTELTKNSKIRHGLWDVLPDDVRHWWSFLEPRRSGCSRVVNVSKRYDDFMQDLESYELGKLKRCLNKEPVRTILCPYGCWEFIEKAVGVPYSSLIQEHDAEFNGFKANFVKLFSRRRGDWLIPKEFLQWIVAPSCRIDEDDGLCFLMCSRHGKGVEGDMVYSCENPVTGLFPPIDEEVLGPLRLRTNIAKCGRATYSGYTYKLMKACADYNGVSTFGLNGECDWDVVSEYLSKQENVIMNERPDIKAFTNQRYIEGEIPECVVSELNRRREYSKDVIKKVTASSSWVPADQLVITVNGKAYKKVQVCTAWFTREDDDEVENDRMIECRIVGEIVRTRSLNRWNEYPLLPLFDKWKSYECGWSLAVVLLNETKVWRLLSEKCESQNNWRSVVLCKLDSELGSLRRKVNAAAMLYLNRIQNIDAFVEEQLEVEAASDIQSPVEMCCKFLGWVEKIHAQLMRDRGEEAWNEVRENIGRNDEITILWTRDRRRRRRLCRLEEEIEDNYGRNWELRIVMAADKCFIRAGEATWGLNRKYKVAEKEKWIQERNKLLGGWNMLIYVRGSAECDVKKEMLAHIGGQAVFECEICGTYLVREPHGSGRKCCFENCNFAMYFSCMRRTCNMGVCRKHYKEHLERGCLNVKIRGRDDVRSNRRSSGTDDSYDAASGNDMHDNARSAEGVWRGSGNEKEITVSGWQGIKGHVLVNGLHKCLERRGRPLTLTTAHQRFLQAFIGTGGIPYNTAAAVAEAHLFPGLFFKGAKDGAVHGALPTNIWCVNGPQIYRTLANEEDQLRTRILSGALQAGRSASFINYAFALMFNKKLRHADSRLIMKRGYYALSEGKSGVEAEEPVLPFEEIDSRKQVKRLASSMLSNPENVKIFITLTCNQKKHFGIAPLREAIEEVVEHLPPDEAAAVQEGTVVDLTLGWARTAEYLVRYLKMSKEKIFGDVQSTFARFEFQDSTANLPHLHLLLTMKSGVKVEEIRQKIICATSRAHDLGCGWHVCPREYKKLIQSGLADDLEDCESYMNDFRTIQAHDCKKGGYRCTKRRRIRKDNGVVETVYECRVPRYKVEYEHYFEESVAPHDETALIILQRLGLAHLNERTGEIEVGEELRAGRHGYPADPDEKISPTNGLLFFVCRSSSNIQITDTFFNCKYLCKYLCGKEERATVGISAGGKENGLHATVDRIRNIKLGCKRMRESMLDSRKRREEIKLISLPECIWWLLKIGYILTDENFVECTTKPLAQRIGVVRHCKEQRLEEYDAFDNRENVLNLPLERRFTYNQRILYRDRMSSECGMDNFTLFQLRAPELRFIDSPRKFFECLVWKNVRDGQMLVEEDLEECPWIDAIGKQWRIRADALDDVMMEAINSAEPLAYEIYSTILRVIQDDECSEEFKRRYVDYDEKRRKKAIVVMSMPRSNSVMALLCHILFTQGRYVTELDLFENGNMTEAFITGNLIDGGAENREAAVEDIVRFYTVNDLKFNPSGGTRVFDLNLKGAYRILRGLLIEGRIPYEEVPVTEEHILRTLAVEDWEERNRERRLRIAKCMLQDTAAGDVQCPTAENFANATVGSPLRWANEILGTASQSVASIDEQNRILREVKRIISLLEAQNAQHFTPHILLEGLPGCGKSFVLKKICLELLARGLNPLTSALSSERAISVGGRHLHVLFQLVVEEGKYAMTAEQAAYKALQRLCRKPSLIVDLQRCDALIIDELFTISAEQYHILDIILRHVKHRSEPYGNILLVASGDFRQLPPITGHRLTIDPTLIMNFQVFRMRELVRSDGDANLQRVLRLMSEPRMSESDIEEVCSIIEENCQFSDDWNDVPDACIRVFGRRKAADEQIERYLNRLARNGNECYTFEARDETTNNNGTSWVIASEAEKRALDRALPESRALRVARNCVMRMTTVDRNGRWCQGQLCIVVDINEEEKKLKVRIAPPNIRHVNPNTITNYPLVTLCGRESHTISTGRGSHSRRWQFELRHNFATTAHRLMGETALLLGTAISQERSHLKLWQRQQWYVIISRVRRLRDLYIIGDKTDAVSAIQSLCRQTDEWSVYEKKLMDKLCGERNGGRAVTMHTSCMDYPIRVNDREPPRESGNFIYLIQSRHGEVTYIGESDNIYYRLQQHNSGHGSAFTKPIHRRPWSLVAYIRLPPNMSRNRRLQIERSCQHAAYGVGNQRLYTTSTDEAIRAVIRTVEGIEDARIVITGKRE